MESFPKNEIKSDNMEMNNFYDSKRKKIINYFKDNNNLDKKRSNSLIITNKSKNLAKKFHFTNQNINSIRAKSYKKQKTFQFESEKKISIFKPSNKRNLIKHDSNSNLHIKKIVTFSKNKYENNNRIIFIEDMNSKDFFKKRRTKQFNSFDIGQLVIPLKSKKEYKKEDFEVISLSGKGAYGTVLQVKLKSDIEQETLNKNKKEKFYAIKVIDIESIKRVNKFYQIYLESQILNELNSPFIVKIYGTFYSKAKLYIILDYLSNGDFGTFLKMNYPLKLDTIRFYAAEIVLFLEYLQSQKIVHRDLKPENIMLNDKYHLTIIDFATVRKVGYYYDKNEMKFRQDNYDLENDNEDIKGRKVIVNPDDDDDDDEEEIEDNINDFENGKNRKIKKIPPRNKTFVGTAEYVSPEVINDQTAGYGADLWAFGIILYQMFYGKTPFKGENTYLTFKNIEKLNISYDKDISIPDNAKDLINKILIRDPSKRLGAGEPKTDLDLQHLKKHPFFKGIKWNNIINQNVPNSKLFKFKINKKKLRRKKVNKNEDEIKENENSNVIILKKGTLLKKSFWFHYNERYLILDSTPKITYKEPEKDVVKGIIYLNKKCRVYASRQDIFNLETPKDVFKFKCKQNDIVVWINAIKESIKVYGKNE